MFCQKCGNKIEEDSTFCIQCGTSVEEAGNTEEDGINIKKIKKVWRAFGYAWTVIVNIITILVVAGIYNALYDDFEIIVVSLLILIYLSIQTLAMTYGSFAVDSTFVLDAEFKRIRKILQKNEIDEYEEKAEEEEIKKARKKTDRAKTKMYINIGFACIIYIIALFNLFGAL